MTDLITILLMATKRNNEEEKAQVACFKWFRDEWPQHHMSIFAPNNEGTYTMSKNPSDRLKASIKGQMNSKKGVTSGVSDIVITVRDKDGACLFIELKIGRNKASENQLQFINRMIKNGHKAIVITGKDRLEVRKRFQDAVRLHMKKERTVYELIQDGSFTIVDL